MTQEFTRIIRQHRIRYPLMEPQDYGKLAVQSEFGARHFTGDRQSVLSALKAEQKALESNQKASPVKPEPIGGGLCRFPVSACKGDIETGLLADLFIETARCPEGTKEGLLEKTDCLRVCEITGMAEWLSGWEQEGFPALRHSEAYRKAYRPHYRLLREEYAAYFPALAEICRLTGTEKNVLIGIDGRCGSGKTHFAKLAQSMLPCNVIHMDDFYLPEELREAGWEKIPGGNMDFARLNREVLLPARQGKQAVYRAYRCDKAKITTEQLIPRRSVTLVEGSYSHHPEICGGYDLKIFLDCGKEEQKQRLKAREGSYYPMFEKRWIPMEEQYFAHYGIEAGCGLQVDTSGLFHFTGKIVPRP